MRFFLSVLLFFTFLQEVKTQSTLDDKIIGKVEQAFIHADHVELGKLLTSTITLDFLQSLGQWNVSQAILLIKDFFIQYPLKSFEVTHVGKNTHDKDFLAALYKTNERTFNVYIVFQHENDRITISKICIKEH